MLSMCLLFCYILDAVMCEKMKNVDNKKKRPNNSKKKKAKNLLLCCSEKNNPIRVYNMTVSK